MAIKRERERPLHILVYFNAATQMAGVIGLDNEGKKQITEAAAGGGGGGGKGRGIDCHWPLAGAEAEAAWGLK